MHNMHFYQRWSNKHQGNQSWHQTWTWLMITYTFIEFLSLRAGRLYLDSKLILLYGKQSLLSNRCEIISIPQRGSRINQISSKQYWWEYHECRAPTKALINFAWACSMNSIVWNHKIYTCLEKKIEKISWKSNKIVKTHAGRKMTAKDLLKSGF